MVAVTLISGTLDLALSGHSRLKLGETSLPPTGQSFSSNPNYTRIAKPSNWYHDALDVVLTARGVGYNFGKGVPFARHTKPLKRGPFVLSSLLELIRCYLVSDVAFSLLPCIPGSQASVDASRALIHLSLPPLHRYFVSSTSTLLIGIGGYHMMNLVHLIPSIVAVGLFNQSPLQWPPLFNSPMLSDSLHNFWNHRWHQCVRRTAIVLGGIPGEAVGGRVGFVVGAFMASGVFHEFGFVLFGRGFSWWGFGYFLIQGVGMMLEEVWRRVSGKRVSGLLGWAWTAVVLVGFGQFCSTWPLSLPGSCSTVKLII